MHANVDRVDTCMLMTDFYSVLAYAAYIRAATSPMATLVKLFTDPSDSTSGHKEHAAMERSDDRLRGHTLR